MRVSERDRGGKKLKQYARSRFLGLGVLSIWRLSLGVGRTRAEFYSRARLGENAPTICQVLTELGFQPLTCPVKPKKTKTEERGESITGLKVAGRKRDDPTPTNSLSLPYLEECTLLPLCGSFAFVTSG